MALKPYYVFTDLQVARLNANTTGISPAMPTFKLINSGARQGMYAVTEAIALANTNFAMKAICAVMLPVAVEESTVTA